ncbi:MAG TPA: hypothetical protein PK431_17365 [Chitinophagales bacterium]|nr:hypothetical protein [Chitinophagales bacterium]
MQNAINLIKLISKDLNKNWQDELFEYNMPDTFKNIYSLDTPLANANRIICFIVYSYSPESFWLDLKKDRQENKIRILNNLEADINLEIFDDILNNRNEIVGMAIFDFLEGLKSWKWRAIFDLLDYSSKMFRFATQETEEERTIEKLNKEGEVKRITTEYDIETISKVNKEKGLLLEAAIAKRKNADVLLDEIRKEFVTTDTATQSDFKFIFTDTAKKKDILSWRSFIKNEKPLWEAKQKQEAD